jgi:hypothetical protein
MTLTENQIMFFEVETEHTLDTYGTYLQQYHKIFSFTLGEWIEKDKAYFLTLLEETCGQTCGEKAQKGDFFWREAEIQSL